MAANIAALQARANDLLATLWSVQARQAPLEARFRRALTAWNALPQGATVPTAPGFPSWTSLAAALQARFGTPLGHQAPPH